MHLNKDQDLEQISTKSGFTIFELKDADFSLILPDAYHFKPTEKTFYTKAEIDEIAKLVHTKQNHDLIIVLENGEEMNEPAANTFLKTLEEPGDHVHFVFLVRNASKILPTIKSRAQNYYQTTGYSIADPPQIDTELLSLAKQYITCKPQDLPKFCDKIAKDKKDARTKAIALSDAAIQLAYKSYFVTGQPKYLELLNRLLKANEALKNNGHIKLQLIVGML